MMFFAFGEFCIGAAFLAWAWGEQVWHHRSPLSFWNAPMLLALGLGGLLTGFMILLGVRVTDLIAGIPLPTARPLLYGLGWALVIPAQAVLVWVAALREGKNYSQGLWLSYLACSFAWALYCFGAR